jgi:hypothetical protein
MLGSLRGRRQADRRFEGKSRKKNIISKPIKENLAWNLYFGLRIGLTRQEVMYMPYGQFKDMLSCHSIYTGIADPVYHMSHEDALELR